MSSILNTLEKIVTIVSYKVWPWFLPFMFIIGAFIAITSIFVIKKRTTEEANLKLKNIIGPASISLGGMIGTGAIIGVLGALSKYSASGEKNIEAIVIWVLVGACIMVPVSYSEALLSKIMGKTPKEYIGQMISPIVGKIYAICFVVLVVFGFGGFQFSGIESVSVILVDKFLGQDISVFQRYLFIIIPLVLIAGIIVASKKHEIFMNSMTYMIGTAVIGYFLFFIVFVLKTNEYLPMYLQKIISGVLNPANGFYGIVLGIVLGMQKVLQTAETGLGALAMAAQEADTKPREAAVISLIPTIVTIFVSIVITSYVTSYGIEVGMIQFPAPAVERLSQYFSTAQHVTGRFGLIVLFGFTILSAITTILGSYYYMTKLFKEININKRIAVYMLLLIISGTLAVFGTSVVFEAVDLLLFFLCGINILALALFCINEWRKFEVLEDDDDDYRISS